MSARFDDRDRLVRAHTPDDRLVRHHDALGRRVETVAERPDGPVTGVPSPHVERAHRSQRQDVRQHCF